MKSSRPLSITLATVLAASGTLLIAGPASAATTIGDYTFYDASDFGQETTDYPAEDWFFGDASGTDGPTEFTRFGLALNDETDPGAGNVQILNQNIGTQPTTAAEFVGMVQSLDVYANNTNWTLQIPVFAEPSSTPPQFTTLRPNFQGNIDDVDPGSQQWVTSWAFGSYAAGAIDTLDNFAAALFTGEAPEVLAYGVWVAASESTVVRHIEWRGHLHIFLPVPTRSVSPTSLTVAEATSTGFTLTGTNWIPGSDVYVYVSNSTGDPIISSSSVTATPDSNGTVTVNIVLPSTVTPGTYFITFDDDEPGYFFGDIGFYVDDPFATIVLSASLAATGAADSSVPLLIGGLLLLGGVVAFGISRAQRARTR